MNALIVYCHPEPKSFNATLKDVAKTSLENLGYSVTVSDLYGEKFDAIEQQSHYETRANSDFFAPLAEQRHAFSTTTLAKDVKREVGRLQQADLIIFQFPLWWHAQPAMLKGWFDRVFVSGGLYSSTMRYNHGFFKGKKAICSVTTGAPAEMFGSGERGGDINVMLWAFHYSLYYMGFSVLPPFIAHGIQGHGYSYQSKESFEKELQKHKHNFTERLASWEQASPLEFPGWDDWKD
ncbi:NADPH quinone oxidoreductase [Alphaproteobacteria bacterium 46_93_T64]|nr:NADPH quinone oxidoreductase [Alphaproteobacteria bacterium 46_93_T64]